MGKVDGGDGGEGKGRGLVVDDGGRDAGSAAAELRVGKSEQRRGKEGSVSHSREGRYNV